MFWGWRVKIAHSHKVNVTERPLFAAINSAQIKRSREWQEACNAMATKG